MAVTVNKRLCESLLAWVLLALAGCGGGGGGGGWLESGINPGANPVRFEFRWGV